MTLQELKYILALSETGHFGRAAEQCFISQSTLSTQIKKLESELGVMLFDRGRKQVALTPIGQQVLASARIILEEEQRIRSLVKTQQDPMAQTVRLGAILTLGAYYLPDALHTLRRAHPKLRLLLREDLTENLLQQLHEGKLDAALLATPIKETSINVLPLFAEPFFAALPATHSLAKNKVIALPQLSADKLLLLDEGHCLREQALAVCGLQNGSEEIRATSLETLRQMVSMGVGVTLLPALAASSTNPYMRKTVAIRPLKKPGAERTIALVWRNRSSLDATLQQIAQTLRAHLPAAVRAA